MRYHRTSLMLLAAGCLLLPASLASAQHEAEGIVQLGHGAGADCLASDYCDGTGACGDEGSGSLRDWLGDGRHAARRQARRDARHYHAARCNGGRCGFGGNPHCGHCWLGRCLNAHSPYHCCTYPGDHGWAPPAHRPIYPTPALYSKMFGAVGNAAPAGYRHPMVYMPTDTTQLGFYYQQVPYWQARPGMIPPVPQPDEWHTPYTGVVFTGYEDAASYYGQQGCPEGEVIEHGGAPIESSVPSNSYPVESYESTPVPMHESSPPYSPEPVNPQLVPPAGPEELAPPPPGPATPNGQNLDRSAAAPKLIPVPRN